MSDLLEQALDVLLSAELEPIVDMVLRSTGPDAYEATAHDGRVADTREDLELLAQRVALGAREPHVEPLERALRAARVVERQPDVPHPTLAQPTHQHEPTREPLHSKPPGDGHPIAP